jgi:hypothetical protein
VAVAMGLAFFVYALHETALAILYLGRRVLSSGFPKPRASRPVCE